MLSILNFIFYFFTMALICLALTNTKLTTSFYYLFFSLFNLSTVLVIGDLNYFNIDDLSYGAFIIHFINSLNYTISIVLIFFILSFIVSYSNYSFINLFGIDLKSSLISFNHIFINFYSISFNFYFNLDIVVLIFLYSNLFIFSNNFDFLVFDSCLFGFSSYFSLLVLKQWSFCSYMFVKSSVFNVISFSYFNYCFVTVINYFNFLDIIIPFMSCLTFSSIPVSIISSFISFIFPFHFFTSYSYFFKKNFSSLCYAHFVYYTEAISYEDVYFIVFHSYSLPSKIMGICFYIMISYFNFEDSFFCNSLGNFLFSDMLVYCTSLDVIHSVFIKGILLKFDVMFGKVFYMFISEYLKSYDFIYLEFICFEYCGLYHHSMYSNFLVLDDFYYYFYYL